MAILSKFITDSGSVTVKALNNATDPKGKGGRLYLTKLYRVCSRVYLKFKSTTFCCEFLSSFGATDPKGKGSRLVLLGATCIILTILYLFCEFTMVLIYKFTNRKTIRIIFSKIYNFFVEFLNVFLFFFHIKRKDES